MLIRIAKGEDPDLTNSSFFGSGKLVFKILEDLPYCLMVNRDFLTFLNLGPGAC